MDIRNLTAEQKAAILEYGKDGFNANELKELGLSAKDAEALYKGLAGEAEQVGDIVKFNNRNQTPAEDSTPKKKVKVKDLLSAACGLGALGVLGAGAMGAPIPGGRVLGLALIGIAALTSCTTIELPDHTTNINMDLDIKNEIKMPDNAEEEALLREQIELLKQIIAAQEDNAIKNEENHYEITGVLTKIVDILAKAGNNTETIVNYLKELGTKTDDIIKLLFIICDNDTEIIEILRAINADTKTIVTELAKQGVSIETISAQLTAGNKTAEEILAVQKDILVSIKDLFKGNQTVNEKLDRILEALGKGHELSAETNNLLMKVLDAINGIKPTDTTKLEELLNKVLEKITESIEQDFAMDEKTHSLLHTLIEKGDTLDDHIKSHFIEVLNKLDKIDANILDVVQKIAEIDTTGSGIFATAGIEALLVKISEQVNNFVTQEKEMDEKDHALLTSILENMQNMNADMKTGFGDVIAKLGTLGEADKAIAEAIANLTNVTDTRAKDILAAIAKGQELDAKHYEDLRELIVKNNEIAQGTQDLVKNLGGKIDNLGERAKEILDKLGNLNSGNVTVDLTEITELLKAIKDDTAKNGETLVRIEDKLNLAAQTLNTILATVEGLGEDTKATLLKILAKIPDGCKCEGVDLTVLIEKLDKIIVELQKDPEGKHEGILDDFENTMDGLV